MEDETKRHEQFSTKNHYNKYEQCPMVIVQNIISGKWKIVILWYLSYSTLRFSDIQNKLPNVTRKMLTQQLRSLEDDNLIYRNVYPVIPPRVEYGLTEEGKKILPILELMRDYGAEYLNNNYANENNSE